MAWFKKLLDEGVKGEPVDFGLAPPRKVFNVKLPFQPHEYWGFRNGRFLIEIDATEGTPIGLRTPTGLRIPTGLLIHEIVGAEEGESPPSLALGGSLRSCAVTDAPRGANEFVRCCNEGMTYWEAALQVCREEPVMAQRPLAVQMLTNPLRDVPRQEHETLAKMAHNYPHLAISRESR